MTSSVAGKTPRRSCNASAGSGYGSKAISVDGFPVKRYSPRMDTHWTDRWPTEPGLYLFYGDYGHPGDERYNPRFQLCRVDWAGHGEGLFLLRVADGCFLDPKEQSGVFQRQEVEPPILPPWPLAMVDHRAITALLRWREQQRPDHLKAHPLWLALTDFLYCCLETEVPREHRAALRAFQGLSKMNQAELVKRHCGE